MTPAAINKSMLKKISTLALPVMLSNLLQTVMTAIDTLMIGRLGPIPIAAVGMGNTIRFFMLIVVLSVAGGAISLIAQAKGSRDKRQMSFVARQSIIAGLLLSVLLGLVGLLVAHPFLTLMNQGGEAEAVQLGTTYLYVLFAGMPFLVLNIVMDRLMQGAGDTLTPLILTSVMLFVNVLLNYILLFGWGPIPAMGVAGVALGTVIARGLICCVVFWLFRSGKNVVHILPGSWHPDRQLFRDIFDIGIPSGIQGIFRHASNLMVIGIVTATSLGTYGAAVLTIGTQIEQLLIQPIVGLNVAATSLVGQDVGKWQIRDAFRKGSVMTAMGVVTMALLVAPFYFFAEEVIRLFDPSGHPKILEGGLSFFYTTLWALPVAAVGIMLAGTLRGAGDTRPAMYSTIFNRGVVQIGLGWWLAIPMQMGYVGVWYGIVISRFLNSGFLAAIWMRRKWLKVALNKTAIFRTHLKGLSSVEAHHFLREVRAPQMAMPGTEEVVEDRRVVYRKGKREVVVYFENGKWRLERE